MVQDRPSRRFRQSNGLRQSVHHLAYLAVGALRHEPNAPAIDEPHVEEPLIDMSDRAVIRRRDESDPRIEVRRAVEMLMRIDRRWAYKVAQDRTHRGPVLVVVPTLSVVVILEATSFLDVWPRQRHPSMPNREPWRPLADGNGRACRKVMQGEPQLFQVIFALRSPGGLPVAPPATATQSNANDCDNHHSSISVKPNDRAQSMPNHVGSFFRRRAGRNFSSSDQLAATRCRATLRLSVGDVPGWLKRTGKRLGHGLSSFLPCGRR